MVVVPPNKAERVASSGGAVSAGGRIGVAGATWGCWVTDVQMGMETWAWGSMPPRNHDFPSGIDYAADLVR